ncbi:MAG: tRNA-binding protein [Candidatus Aenigmatarchaeota archaeon]
MVEESPFDVKIQVGRVKEAKDFPETKKSGMCKLWIDMGDEEIQSCAQLMHHHKPKELEGKQVLVATNLGSVRIAGFKSEGLTLGVPGKDGKPVLVTPDKEVPLGGELY